MITSSASRPGPVTPDDLDAVVWAAVEALRGVPDDAWDRDAAGLEWTCRETADHLIDDLFAYAAQLAPRVPPTTAYVRFAWERRPEGPALSVRADPEGGTAAVVECLESAGALLSAVVRTKGAETRAYHVLGVSDPEGYAAMGIVEVLAHTHDLVGALGVGFRGADDVCERVLYRLFQDVPDGAEPWAAFLWATGRGELPGRPRLAEWRWYGAPRAQW